MGVSSAKRAQVAVRRSRAIAMRLEGRSYDQIAQELGYSSRATACKDVTRATEIAILEQRAGVEVLREQELMRLDQLWQEVWRVLKTEHYVLSQGRIVERAQSDGTVAGLLDDGPVLQAIDRLLKIQERRSKYLGLDAPVRHEVTLDELDDQIRTLTRELGLSVTVEAHETPRAEETEEDQG